MKKLQNVDFAPLRQKVRRSIARTQLKQVTLPANWDGGYLGRTERRPGSLLVSGARGTHTPREEKRAKIFKLLSFITSNDPSPISV